MKEYLQKLCAGVNLDQAEAKIAMSLIMEGEATPSQVAAFLVALKMKGETAGELYGCASAMRERATAVRSRHSGLTDTCGTGGDGKGTFNISTLAALIASGAGLPVAKHGNRSVSSRCGSADVLEAMGVRLELTPEQMGACLDEVGFAFLYAPLLHQAMRHAAVPRREVGVRSVFNLLGPLTNPAGATRQVLGVYAPGPAACLAQVLLLLGTEKAMVVHGSDGSDELTLAGETLVYEIKEGSLRCFLLNPEDVGLERSQNTIPGGSPKENAALMLEVLMGRRGSHRDVSLLNAAAALYVGGLAEDLRHGVIMAENSIDSGAALAKLEELLKFTERCDTSAQTNCG
ncbi:MAG: anthranilate phosphoribosyltransferase [Dethiobacter sp.]|jgi:anthranilate phosphoribosyltransferase|nr:anthranilate phosphoribosyltransferase [Dethiobacter sp.]